MTPTEALVDAFIEALRETQYIDISAHSLWEEDDDVWVRKTDPQDIAFWMPMVEAFCAAMLEHMPEGWALYDLADRDSVRDAAREGARSRMRSRRSAAQGQQGQGDGGDDGDVDEQDVVHGGAV